MAFIAPNIIIANRPNQNAHNRCRIQSPFTIVRMTADTGTDSSNTTQSNDSASLSSSPATNPDTNVPADEPTPEIDQRAEKLKKMYKLKWSNRKVKFATVLLLLQSTTSLRTKYSLAFPRSLLRFPWLLSNLFSVVLVHSRNVSWVWSNLFLHRLRASVYCRLLSHDIKTQLESKQLIEGRSGNRQYRHPQTTSTERPRRTTNHKQ